MAPGVRVHLLGDVAVQVDGAAPPRLRSPRRAASLLALLLDAPRGLTRAEAADLLWPRAAPAAARAELSRLLHDLRQRLGPVVDAGARTLRLVPGALTSDVTLLAEAVGSHDPELWQHAVDAVRGPFLADVDVDVERGPEDALAAWVGQQRLLHAARTADLHARLTRDAAARGDHTAALARARRWVESSPLDEAAHRAVITAFARTGQRDAAASHYERLVEDLAGQLGADPEAATTALAADVAADRLRPDGGGRAGGAAAQLPGAVRGAPPSPSVPSLPRRVGHLVGRDAPVAAAERLLSQPGSLVTLCGPGGVGKTRLATEVAHRAARTVASGAPGTVGAAGRRRVVWVDLSPVREVGDVLATLSAVLRAASGDDAGADPRSAAVRLLAGDDVLLVLDNLEQLPGVGAVVGDLLQALPRLQVLATSRGPVHLRGERVVSLGPLAQDDAEAFLTAALQDAGVALPGPDDADGAAEAHEVVAEVCRQLDGLPLALELAASQARVLGVHGLRDRLRGPRGWLVAPRAPESDRPPRHRTLLDAVRWSADLLPLETRRVFDDLGVFAGPFLAESAAAVAVVPAEHLDDHLAALVDVGLLQPLPPRVLDHGSAGGQRYRMLPTVAAVANDELVTSGRARSAREAHRRLFADRASAAGSWGTDAAGRDQNDRLAELHADVADVRVALACAAEVSAEVLAEQVLGLRELWWSRRHGLEACEWIRRALTSGLGGLDPVTRVSLLVMESHHRSILPDLEHAERVIAEASDAVEHVRAEGTAGLLRARIDTARAVVSLYRDDLQGAAATVAAALGGVERWQEQAQREGFVDPEAWVAAVYYSGATTYYQNDVEATARWAALGLREALRMPAWTPACVVGIGDVARQRGDARTALGHYAAALTVARRSGEVSTPRVIRLLAAACALMLGDAAASARLLGAMDAAVELAPELWMPESAAGRDALAAQLEAVLGPGAALTEMTAGRSMGPAQVEDLVYALAGDAVPDLGLPLPRRRPV